MQLLLKYILLGSVSVVVAENDVTLLAAAGCDEDSQKHNEHGSKLRELHVNKWKLQ